MPETNVQNTEPTTAPEPEKTFTQADVDALIQKRLDRERKKYPTDEEITAYRKWKESQQTEQEKWNALTGERDTARTQLAAAQADLEQYKREKLLLGKGIPAEDVDYYVFKIAKLVTDTQTFEQAAENFIKENAPSRVRVDMTAPLDRGNPTVSTANDTMNALIRGALR